MHTPLSSKSEVPYLTRYTAVQIKKPKVVIMKNMDDFHYAKQPITCNHQINITQRGTLLVNEEYIVHTAVCQKAQLTGSH